MTLAIHTIGHSRHTAEALVALLRGRNIARLVDVRSHPVSKWAPHFAKAPLAHHMAASDIDYQFLGRELGGLLPDGVDYAARAVQPEFITGIERLVELARASTTAILCAEEDPAHCHRRILISPALQRAGVAVLHIRGDGRVEREPPMQLSLF